MPKNSKYGVLIGFFSTFLGFSAVWHIWWLFFFSFAFITMLIIVRSFIKSEKQIITSNDVLKIESQWIKHLNKKKDYDRN